MPIFNFLQAQYLLKKGKKFGKLLRLYFQRLNALPRDGRDTLFLLVVIGWVLMPQTANLPLWCSALSASILCWRGWLAWGSRPLPSRWWLFGLLGLTVPDTPYISDGCEIVTNWTLG